MTFPLFHRPGTVVFLDDDPDYLEMLALVLPRHWHLRLFLRPTECISHLLQEPPFWEADAWNQQQLVDLWREGKPLIPQVLAYWSRYTERYALSREFLTIWRELLERSHRGESFDFEGTQLRVKGSKLLYPPVTRPYPPVFFGGSSPEAHELAAEQLDTYLTWGEPPAAVAEKVADIRARAARHGRTLTFGIRLHVIVRETEDEAWRAAADLVSHLDEATVTAAQQKFAQMDSVGQRRMAELHRGRFNRANVREGLEVSPNLWAGVGLVRGGAGTALVGNPRQVADRIQEYAALGLEHFIFSGYPHLEEAHRVAELVFPLLPLSLRERLPQQTLTGPFGEIVANSFVPQASQS